MAAIITRTRDFILHTWPGRALGVLMIVAAGSLAGLGWWLGSPLFINMTVDEAFPISSEQFPRSASAEIPPDMTREQVEQLMVAAEMNNQEAKEERPEAMSIDGGDPIALKMGTFTDADRFHTGSGSATIYDLPEGPPILRFEDFRVTNGPELHVILSKAEDPESRSEVTSGGFEDLGVLKGNIGNQNYEIPTNVDISQFNSVVIYCLPFHVIFSVATLTDSPQSTTSAETSQSNTNADDEKFPRTASAEIPSGMTREEAEQIMILAETEDMEISEPLSETVVVDGVPSVSVTPNSNAEGASASGNPAPPPTVEPTIAPTVAPTATTVPRAEGPVQLKSGTFRGADSFHRGSGSATIYDLPDGRLLRLENFSVTNGPQLHVYLSAAKDPQSSRGVRGEGIGVGYIDLGQLKGNRGNQNYEIPENVNISQFNSVVIYCVPFNVLFSTSPLS